MYIPEPDYQIPLGDELVEAAKQFAEYAHLSIGQKRKYTFEDYIVHPTEVAGIVATVPHTSEMLAAAYLHDTVEDVDWVTTEMILERFGLKVANLVSDLTDISGPEDGNRFARKEIDRQHTGAASNDAKTVKLADLISNSRDIMTHDPNFAVTYMKEKRRSLEVLSGGDATLYAIAKQINDEYFDRLGPKPNKE